MESEITARALRAIEERVFPGCVVGVLKAGRETILPFGSHTYENSPAVTKDTVYDLASITKVIPTAMLAAELLKEGRFSLDEKLITYIPEYRTAHRDRVTIRHLLTYTLGNRLMLSSLANRASVEIFDAVCTEKSDAPGTTSQFFSNTPTFLLGIVIERILGMPLDRAAEERIFKPLGMKSATFHPTNAVPTEEGIQNIVHDESARVFARAGKVVGHAGLFSNTPDLLSFAEHVLGDPHAGELGWEVNQSWMGRARARLFGKTGFTGTCLVCDPAKRSALVILSNRTYPKRPASREKIDAFRADLCDIVFR